MEKQVDYRFKLLYAVGMVFIVAGHCGNGGISLMYDWFQPYAFHLGLFMFASGYFYNQGMEFTPVQYILKKCKSLILPLYLWNFFYGGLVFVSRKLGFIIGMMPDWNTLLLAPITDGHQFMYNMGGWFVIPLFMVQVYNVIVRFMLKQLNGSYKELVFFGLNFSLGVLGVWLASRGFNQGAWLILVRMLYFLPFFEAGILYRMKPQIIDNIPSFLYFLIIFAIQLIVITAFGRQLGYTPSWCNDFTEGPILVYVVAFLGITFWLRVANIFSESIGKSWVVNLIANNTFTIMINQFLGFMFVKGIFAILSYQKIILDFDWNQFKTNIWYYYLPKGVYHWYIVYLLAGLFVPIAINEVLKQCIKLFKKNMNLNKECVKLE